MIVELVDAIDPRTGELGKVRRLTPENDADVAELRRLAAAGEIDDRESFGDGPPRRRRRRRRR